MREELASRNSVRQTYGIRSLLLSSLTVKPDSLSVHKSTRTDTPTRTIHVHKNTHAHSHTLTLTHVYMCVRTYVCTNIFDRESTLTFLPHFQFCRMLWMESLKGRLTVHLGRALHLLARRSMLRRCVCVWLCLCVCRCFCARSCVREYLYLFMCLWVLKTK